LGYAADDAFGKANVVGHLADGHSLLQASTDSRVSDLDDVAEPRFGSFGVDDEFGHVAFLIARELRMGTSDAPRLRPTDMILLAVVAVRRERDDLGRHGVSALSDFAYSVHLTKTFCGWRDQPRGSWANRGEGSASQSDNI
jgi:hypothetical protein